MWRRSGSSETPIGDVEARQPQGSTENGPNSFSLTERRPNNKAESLAGSSSTSSGSSSSMPRPEDPAVEPEPAH
jgi:hypothetical protein